MPHVWRVENVHGLGLYNVGISTDDMQDISGNHPMPWKDIGPEWEDREDPNEWYFGFNDLSQYRRWVHRDARIRFHKHDAARLSLYLVKDHKDVKRGQHQVAFRSDRAVLVDRFPLITVQDLFL